MSNLILSLRNMLIQEYNIIVENKKLDHSKLSNNT